MRTSFTLKFCVFGPCLRSDSIAQTMKWPGAAVGAFTPLGTSIIPRDVSDDCLDALPRHIWSV
jgi:hypothetical protein